MPVHCPITISVPSDDDFREADFKIMGHAFECHNAMGRICDEVIYRSDLAARLESAGLGPAVTQVPVTVSWREFRKNYYLDMVVQNSLVYELKAASGLTGEHKAQLLNYLLLLGLRTGKLVNFRTDKVETYYVSTRLSGQARFSMSVDDSRWKELTPASTDLRSVVTEMLSTIGFYLDTSLYKEMITWHFGGTEKVVRQIPVSRAGVELGAQSCRMISDDTCFKLTAFVDGRGDAETHFRRFVSHTRLRAIQWINLNRTCLELITILR